MVSIVLWHLRAAILALPSLKHIAMSRITSNPSALLIQQDRRATIEAAWKLDYRCWSRDCTPVEHLTREQFEQQQLKKFNDDASLCPHGAPSELSDDLLCNQIRGEMEESLGNEFETRIIHDLCAERWQWRAERLFTLDRDRHDVPQQVSWRESDFHQSHRQLTDIQVFRSVFGLQAMIGRITTNGLRCDSPSYGAFSYICLPSSFRTRTSASDYPIFSRGRSADIYATESGINPELLPRMKAKFVYAMHKLNLQPYQTLSWYSKDYPNEQGMNEAEPKTWPRHVILTRFTSHQAS